METRPKSTNWILWLGLLAVVLIGVPIACCGGFGLVGFNAVKAPLVAAAGALNADPRVTDQIGSPITYDNIRINKLTNNNGEGSAEIDTSFSGPKGSVQVQGQMRLSNNQWSVELLTVTLPDESVVEVR